MPRPLPTPTRRQQGPSARGPRLASAPYQLPPVGTVKPTPLPLLMEPWPFRLCRPQPPRRVSGSHPLRTHPTRLLPEQYPSPRPLVPYRRHSIWHLECAIVTNRHLLEVAAIR